MAGCLAAPRANSLLCVPTAATGHGSLVLHAAMGWSNTRSRLPSHPSRHPMLAGGLQLVSTAQPCEPSLTLHSPGYPLNQQRLRFTKHFAIMESFYFDKFVFRL